MIRLEQVTVRAGAFSLKDIDFEVPTGRYAVLMGRSGSGKTTLLESICGLRRTAGGTIRLQGADVTHWKPADRGVGYVPQDRALFETMTVREHLAFSPVVRRWAPAAVEARVAELVDLLGLTELIDRKPPGLSGGEAQRVALGRALAGRPGILCLDEPLSALDEEIRDEMYSLLESIQQRTGVTVLHVTHSRDEAERLADLIFTVRDGKVVSNG